MLKSSLRDLGINKYRRSAFREDNCDLSRKCFNHVLYTYNALSNSIARESAICIKLTLGVSKYCWTNYI